MKRYLVALTLLIAGGLLISGCGDDDGPDDAGTDSPSRTAEGSPEPVQRTEAIAALRTYLSEVGLDESPGDLTDPEECASLPDGDVDGDYCIVEPSSFGLGLALILVADVDDPENEAWQVRVVLEEEAWQVTEAVRLGAGAE